MPPRESRSSDHRTAPGSPPGIASPLHPLIGVARSLRENTLGLRRFSAELGAQVVGALLVTCSDEAEQECCSVFQQEFVDELLPAMAHRGRAAFKTTSLGARYEAGSFAIAEEHYGSAVGRGASAPGDWKLMVVKINAHVSLEERPDGVRYGTLERYGSDSACCGALSAVLAGQRSDFVGELTQLFQSEDSDRIATLLDPELVEPRERLLFGAILNARLQARRCMREIQQHTPCTPTVSLVLASVTLNQTAADSEILCGVYSADHRSSPARFEYRGLGDQPADYRLSGTPLAPIVDDPQRGGSREVRGL